MKILLVGVDSSLKRDTYDALQKEYPHWDFVDGFPSLFEERGLDAPALGSLSDYRTELLLASYRSHSFGEPEEVEVQLHSLFDSLAYTTVRLSNVVSGETLPDEQQVRWLLADIAIGYLVRDSLVYDLVFFFPTAREDEKFESFALQLDDFYPKLLETLDIPYTVLDATVPENVDMIVTMAADVAAAAQ